MQTIFIRKKSAFITKKFFKPFWAFFEYFLFVFYIFVFFIFFILDGTHFEVIPLLAESPIKATTIVKTNVVITIGLACTSGSNSAIKQMLDRIIIITAKGTNSLLLNWNRTVFNNLNIRLIYKNFFHMTSLRNYLLLPSKYFAAPKNI
jgi:hypothetical protein